MQFETRLINSVEARPVRQQVLRPHQTVEETAFVGDDDPNTFHLGAFAAGELCCIATFMKQDPPDGPNPEAWRLRGMATLETWRGNGLASTLVSEGMTRLRARGATRLWFNARTTAADFYLRFGFEVLGEVFELPNIGPHVVMHAAL